MRVNKLTEKHVIGRLLSFKEYRFMSSLLAIFIVAVLLFSPLSSQSSEPQPLR